MCLPPFFRTFVLAASLATAGCVNHISTTAERAASFSPYAQREIGTANVRDFLLSRSALLVVGDPAAPAIGYATAIDRRGYFLTAAHCVADDVAHVTVSRVGDERHLEPVQVIWRGDLDRHQPDVAILYDPNPLEASFEWASRINPDDVVFSVGPNYERDHGGPLAVACFAGRVVGSAEPAELMPAVRRIVHTAPLHPGDSGGPLVTSDGRLLGINVESEARLKLPDLSVTLRGRAYRPDLGWLRRLIDDDYAKRTHVVSDPTPGAGLSEPAAAMGVVL
jgi:S1-C subfamily serine protease